MTVPKEFRDIFKDMVEHRRFGYTSVPEIARDAFRRLLLDLRIYPQFNLTDEEDQSPDG